MRIGNTDNHPENLTGGPVHVAVFSLFDSGSAEILM